MDLKKKSLDKIPRIAYNIFYKSEKKNMNCEPKYEKVTRVEVIDDTGRAYTNWNVSDLQFSLQDDERTLKVFIVGKKDD